MFLFPWIVSILNNRTFFLQHTLFFERSILAAFRLWWENISGVIVFTHSPYRFNAFDANRRMGYLFDFVEHCILSHWIGKQPVGGLSKQRANHLERLWFNKSVWFSPQKKTPKLNRSIDLSQAQKEITHTQQTMPKMVLSVGNKMWMSVLKCLQKICRQCQMLGNFGSFFIKKRYTEGHLVGNMCDTYQRAFLLLHFGNPFWSLFFFKFHLLSNCA